MLKNLLLSLLLLYAPLSATQFTVGSYNCGGLPDHYDYVRAAAGYVVMQERYQDEPEQLAELEKIQNTALKILFSKEGDEQKEALLEWEENGYQKEFESLTQSPTLKGSINEKWKNKIDATLSPYNIRPIEMRDPKVERLIRDQIAHIVNDESSQLEELNDALEVVRNQMAKHIFTSDLNYDIIALQEGDYLAPSLFPSNYDVVLSDSDHSVNGIAWKKERFELVQNFGEVDGRALVAILREIDSGKTVAIASGHLTGCNPFKRVYHDNPENGHDSEKGDLELEKIITFLSEKDVDYQVVALDSNVTATHPRLSILKESGYQLDYINHLYPTCTNPHMGLDTRIDWIGVKAKEEVIIDNLPVNSVGLNCLKTNISDHKPIAARIRDK